MSDEQARRIYETASIGRPIRRGDHPAVLVVDFNRGFTEPDYPTGADLAAEVAATADLVEVARTHGHPIVFTTIAFAPNLLDAGIWPQKMPGLSVLISGSAAVELDPRLGRLDADPLITKKGASAFFGTNLVAMLTAMGIDTLVLCGATTSGCVRASAIDALQNGYATLVPRECVGDRARAPHEANLFDIHAKYGDVIPVAEARDYLARVTHRPRTGPEGAVA